jgi:hypothetical protein
MDDGVEAEAPGAGGGVNGVQDVEANLRTWTACSIASSSGREERLEMRRVKVNFGRAPIHRFAAEREEIRGQGGAHGGEELIGT